VQEGQACVQEGSIRLNADTRRIPLEWPVFGSKTDAGYNATPRTFRTLSVVGALQAYPSIEAEHRLDEALKPNDPPHPFTNFIRDIPQLPARTVLCGVDFPQDAGADWERSCVSPKSNAAAPPQSTGRLTNDEVARQIKGKTIVIGELNDDDKHDSDLGPDVPGAVLQGNYIQSLLVCCPINKWQ
jgi:hypothetical protein